MSDLLSSYLATFVESSPTWQVALGSGVIVLLSWVCAEMGIFSTSKFNPKDKVRPRHL